MKHLDKVKQKYEITSETKQDLVNKVGLKEFDYAIPQSFFDDMQSLFPGKTWIGVWSYELQDGKKNMAGYPHPLKKEAAEMLKKFNEKYKTHYPTDLKTAD